MGDGTIKVQWDRFDGGIIRATPLQGIPGNAAFRTENQDFYNPTVLALRQGLVDRSATNQPAIAFSAAHRMRRTGTILWASEPGTGAGALYSGSTTLASIGALGTTGSELYPVCMAEFGASGSNDLVLIAFGDTAPQKYDGSTLAALGGSPPVASHVAVWQRRAWLMQGKTASALPWRLYYSALNTPEDWSSVDNAGYIDLPNTGSPVTALIPAGDLLYVFTERETYAITGQTNFDFNVTTLSQTIGCAFPKGWGVFDTYAFVAANDGFYIWNNGSCAKVSTVRDPEMLPVYDTTLAKAVYPRIGTYKNRFFVSYSAYSVADAPVTTALADHIDVFELNDAGGRWYTMLLPSGMRGVTCFVNAETTGTSLPYTFLTYDFQTRRVLAMPAQSVTDPSTGLLKSAPVMLDQTTALPLLYETGATYVVDDQPELIKELKSISIVGQGLAGAIKITPIVDGTTLTARNITLGTGAPNLHTYGINWDGSYKGNSFRFRFETDGTTASQKVQIHKIVVTFDVHPYAQRKQ